MMEAPSTSPLRQICMYRPMMMAIGMVAATV